MPNSYASGKPSDRIEFSVIKSEAIREAYKQTFQQESVLRVDSRAGVSF
ncbi:MAG: DUF3574 domain-containing protein [Blastocatellia bacterium]